MTHLERLLSIASPALAEPSEDGFVPDEISKLLALRNGFFAFEGALRVFPSATSVHSTGLAEWNSVSGWRRHFPMLSQEAVCFAEDIFGCQFVIWRKDVMIFEPETGALTPLGTGLEQWAERILADYDFLTGHAIARQWQSENGRLPFTHRLLPLTPFVAGGAYKIDNLIAVEASLGMELRAAVALRLRDLPDGAQVLRDDLLPDNYPRLTSRPAEKRMN